MKNVFIICAGRTASTTFTHACSHIKNFTSAHESRVAFLGSERVAYPNNHIEIDNRLAWFLPHLEKAYGDEGYYLYLTRDHEKIAKSYLERWHLKESIVKAYGHGILMKETIRADERYDICLDYVQTVDLAITSFLKNKPNVMRIDVSELNERFNEFYDWIDAEGDVEKCIEELHNFSNKNNTNVVKKIVKTAVNVFK